MRFDTVDACSLQRWHAGTRSGVLICVIRMSDTLVVVNARLMIQHDSRRRKEGVTVAKG